MKTSMRNFLVGALLGASFSVNSFADVINNNSIISMLKKGYSTEIIIGQLENNDRELSADISDIDALIAAGADTHLISFIQKSIKADHGLTNGMYWMPNGQKPQKLVLANVEKDESGFNGSFLYLTSLWVAFLSPSNMGEILTGGSVLGTANFSSEKLVLPGGSACMKLNTRNPVFRFSLSGSTSVDPSLPAWYNQWIGGIQSPNEFQLIRLDVKGKDKKARRVFPSGLKWGVGGFSTSKQSTKNLVAFNIRQLDNLTFELTMPEELAPGHYAFFYKNDSNPIFKERLTAFDFTIE